MPGPSQLLSLAGHLVVAILCPHRGRIFDHMGAAILILCVGVIVNLHITLLLDRIEAWCMGGGQLVCPEGCPGSGWGFPWGMGWSRRGTCGGFQAGHAPWQPKQRPWYLEFIYLLQLKLCSLEWRPRQARAGGKLGFFRCLGNPSLPPALCGCSHIGWVYLHTRSDWLVGVVGGKLAGSPVLAEIFLQQASSPI